MTRFSLINKYSLSASCVPGTALCFGLQQWRWQLWSLPSWAPYLRLNLEPGLTQNERLRNGSHLPWALEARGRIIRAEEEPWWQRHNKERPCHSSPPGIACFILIIAPQRQIRVRSSLHLGKLRHSLSIEDSRFQGVKGWALLLSGPLSSLGPSIPICEMEYYIHTAAASPRQQLWNSEVCVKAFWGTNDRLYFGGLQKHCRWWL